ncbi:hypothetical protein GSI_14331 [Ganoderma sinense ZZ0214-1]|uniref:F-box domain-containing protein n=1 Tax=Ganoderma sinense ZZ0214-1 TaxID=1077348 RepID=A0A2G8RND1_9APHY|nr:hypothetical protein GSI_14331 [Ganoderma sinense ZZ0214-1]
MTPHRALTNYDILLSIFRQFALVQRPYDVNTNRPNAYWGPSHPVLNDNIFNCERSYTYPMEEERKTLLSLSLTCKAFSELALSELWSAPYGGLYALLRLFSSFTHREASYASWKFESRTYFLHEYYFSGDLSHDDWTVFRRCATRVRELEYHTYWDIRIPYRIEGSVFAELFEKSAGQPLFPNLQMLSWQQSSPDEDLNMLARIIAPPTLSVLKLHHPMWLDYKPSFVPAHFTMDGQPEDLHIFTNGCPMLEHILIDLIFPPHDLYSIANCRRLRSLSVEKVPLEVLWSLEQLPNLTHLSVELLGEESPVSPHTCPLEPTLASFYPLRSLSFTNSLPSPIISFLTRISPIALTSVNLLLVRTRSDDVPRALRALCSDRFTHTLRVIRLTFECVEAERNGESERCHFLSVARPLLSIASLEVLAFSIYTRALVLSDCDVSEMARSWPCIVSLSVTHDPKYIDPKDRPRDTRYTDLVRPSLSALISLGERCSSLESMKFDPANVSEEELKSLEAHSASTGPRPTLSQLVPVRSDALDDLAIHDVQRLASALHRIFPNLEGKGVLAKHERRPLRARLTDWDTGWKNQADELLRSLDALCAAERERERSSRCAAS